MDDDPDDRDVALQQPAGEGVGDVVERPRRVEDPRARRGADRVGAAETTRDTVAVETPASLATSVMDATSDQNGNVGGSSRTVTHCHSVNVSRLASPP